MQEFIGLTSGSDVIRHGQPDKSRNETLLNV